jgi:osmotically-inducible protein OsmY
MRSTLSFVLGAAAGAAAAHLLDPESGSARRAQLRDQAASRARQGASGAQAQAQHVANRAQAAAGSAGGGGSGLEDPDDVTLARKVETEIFRDADAPKGAVSVDVQAGVVNLRGEVAADWIGRLGEAAGKVDGINGVQNLLHEPGTPTPEARPSEHVAERMS